MISDEQLAQYRENMRGQERAALLEWRVGRLVDVLRSAGQQGVTRSDLLRRSKSTAAEFERMLAAMVDRQLVTIEVTASAGRPRMTIRAIPQ